MKWNITPKIKTGCKRNCTKGLVPIKWEASLNASGLITEREFITRCWSKKNIKNNPENNISSFIVYNLDSIKLKKLYNRIKKVNSDFQILSMGMSNDYKTAIEFGATHIRIGSKLFGDRLEKEEIW